MSTANLPVHLPARSPIHVSSDILSSTGRAAQDVALAALIGGNLFGRMAMHPALAEVSDERERGRVLNQAWRRYGAVNSVALATLIAGWLPARLNETRPAWLSRRERVFATAKDAALTATVISGLATAFGGIAFSDQAPGGAVPMASGNDPSAATPPRAARLKRLINVISTVNLVSELALATSNAFLAQTAFRRPPLRRMLRRRY